MFNRVYFVLVMAFFLSACSLEPPEGKLQVGTEAPSLRTKFLQDVDGDMSRLTTYRYPDERMYQYSLDAALSTGKTVLVEFATPGHCTVCDKQLQMLKAMVEKYGEEVIFLHMDQYKNPGAFKAYDVKGDPWTFVINKQGVVHFKRAGRMLYAEMDKAIELTIASGERI